MLYTFYNAIIVTVDKKNNIYSDGAMIVKDGRIVSIGKKQDIEFQGELVDMKGKILMPGLINTHTHSHSSVFRNIIDDMKLLDWLQNGLWPREKYINAECAMKATAFSCLEYIKNGITTYADQFFYANDIAKIAQKSGLRAFIAATILEKGTSESNNTLEKATDFISNWIGKEEKTLVYPCIGPHAPYSVTEEQFKEVIKIAQKYKILIHTHISETAEENEIIYNKYGCTPTKWLESIGLFSQNVLAAHSVHLNEQDLQIYSKNNVKVSYNPVSNLKLCSGIMPLEKMYAHGITVSIGTDGAQSNNSMDLLQDIKIGTLIQKQKLNLPTFMNSEQCVRMLTIDGAKALGVENEVGSLEIGKKADFITFSTDALEVRPLYVNNLYSAITYSLTGANVVDTVVNGRWIMKERIVKTLNEKDVINEAQKISEYIEKNVI